MTMHTVYCPRCDKQTQDYSPDNYLCPSCRAELDEGRDTLLALQDYRAYTLKRQWAEQFVNGTKHYEIRNFNTSYRGTVVITLSGEKIAYALAELTDVIPTSAAPGLNNAERAFGKWAHKLDNVRLCVPIPCKGQLGLWAWHDTLPAALKTVNTQLKLF